MMVRKVVQTACALLLMMLMTSVASAGTVTVLYDGGGGTEVGLDTGVRLTSPDTYGSCSATTDLVQTTGVGSRVLRGQILVEYVTGDGRILVPNGYYAINQVGDLNLTVSYPPAYLWPTNEIHVDIQLELYENGWKVASLGGYQLGVPPANDWDVFCNDKPPPPPPPTGGEGCTPGYWKQSQHVDSWPTPYTPATTFAVAFGVGPANLTLQQALNLNGGGEKAMIRHATAALLNAANPDVSYTYTVSQVRTMVQQAYASGVFEETKDRFATENEAGCPLN